MKGTGAAVLAASLAAVASSAAAVVSLSPDPYSVPDSQSSNQGYREQKRRAEDRFAPRFDGLRFIETLVTAHR